MGMALQDRAKVAEQMKQMTEEANKKMMEALKK